MFFDDRKKVSLGGKSRKGNESKQAFVDRTRQEREAREAERRRQSSVGAGLSGGAAVWQAVASFAALLRRFQFFMRESDPADQARLTRLAMWLLAGTVPPVNAVCALLRGEDGAAWLRRVSALCLHCLRRLGRSGGEGALVDAAWLLRLCSADAHGGDAAMAGTIQSMLVQAGLFRALRCQLDINANEQQQLMLDSNATEQQQLMVIGIVGHVLNGHVEGAQRDFCVIGIVGHVLNGHVEGAQRDFCVHLLTRQGFIGHVEGAQRDFRVHLLTRQELFRRLGERARMQLLGSIGKPHEQDGVWERALEALSDKQSGVLASITANGTLEDATFLLGNLVELSTSFLSSSSLPVTGRFALCAGRANIHPNSP
ncbi:hypothetical protein T484DRAFT_1770894 [Baffinella frigidus]|nr:hypothetical protein T484DRAFT_1770894 [Cryptophyta sp. CCMP2293]